MPSQCRRTLPVGLAPGAGLAALALSFLCAAAAQSSAAAHVTGCASEFPYDELARM